MIDLAHGSLLGDLEVRSSARGRSLRGRFPYNRRAVLSDGGRNGGRPQKEEFAPRAFEYRIKDPEAEIHLLVGHSYDKPLASKLGGTLKLRDTDDALTFEAEIDQALAEVSHVRDALALLGAGLMVGISPGFRIPPPRAVPKSEAEEWIDEEFDPDKGMHRAQIRRIKQALLYELSIVTSPAYKDAAVEPRAPTGEPRAIIPARTPLVRNRQLFIR